MTIDFYCWSSHFKVCTFWSDINYIAEEKLSCDYLFLLIASLLWKICFRCTLALKISFCLREYTIRRAGMIFFICNIIFNCVCVCVVFLLNWDTASACSLFPYFFIGFYKLRLLFCKIKLQTNFCFFITILHICL